MCCLWSTGKIIPRFLESGHVMNFIKSFPFGHRFSDQGSFYALSKHTSGTDGTSGKL